MPRGKHKAQQLGIRNPLPSFTFHLLLHCASLVSRVCLLLRCWSYNDNKRLRIWQGEGERTEEKVFTCFLFILDAALRHSFFAFSIVLSFWKKCLFVFLIAAPAVFIQSFISSYLLLSVLFTYFGLHWSDYCTRVVVTTPTTIIRLNCVSLGIERMFLASWSAVAWIVADCCFCQCTTFWIIRLDVFALNLDSLKFWTRWTRIFGEEHLLAIRSVQSLVEEELC